MVVKRGDIIDALCRGLPDGVVSFGNEFQRFEQLGDGEGVKLYFNKGGGEGTTCTVGILVDASGTRSRVRQQLIGDKPLPSVLWVSGIVPLRAAAAYTSDMDGNFLETVYVGKDYIFFIRMAMAMSSGSTQQGALTNNTRACLTSLRCRNNLAALLRYGQTW